MPGTIRDFLAGMLVKALPAARANASGQSQAPVIVNASPENPSTSLSNPAEWLVNLFGGGPSLTGRNVSPESAMRTSAVYGCVSLIAQTIASLPLKVFRTMPNGESVEQPDNPVYYLLHSEPNATMTSTVFRELMVANVLLGGNAYAAIGRTNGNRPFDLIPLLYQSVEAYRKDARLKYKVRLSDGSAEIIDQSDMIHVPGLGFDGLSGLSVISHAAKESVGLALAAEEHGARVFSNGASLKVVATHPRNLSEPAQKRLKAQFDEQYSGLSNVARTLVLEEGMSVSNVSMSQQDAQYLETRQFQVEDIARFFRVPPHLIGHTSKQTSWGTGVEQMLLGFLTFTIVPWLVRFEQELNRKLFPRSPFYVQFKTQGLMRGDSTARSAYYASGHQNGWLSINEIRKMEDMPPIPGGDRHFVQVNLVPIELAGTVKPEPAKPEPSAPTTQKEGAHNEW